MTPYPVDFPKEAAKLIVADIRSGTAGTDKAKLAKAAWELEGFALKSAFGDPATGALPSTAHDLIAQLTDQQVADHLHDLISHVDKGISLPSWFPWPAIAAWFQKKS